MRKVLILAYDFPPYVSVGGLRPYNWFKYLKEYGVEPIIVTRQWANKYGNELDYVAPGSSSEIIIEKTEQGTIIRTPYHPNLSNRLLLKHGANKYRLLRKGISAIYEIAQFIVPIGPKAGIYRAAKKYLSTNKVDAILATGEPFVLFHYAHKLSKKYRIPWIADYRDPWSNGVHLHQSMLLYQWKRIIEKRTVKSASHITTVDHLFKRKIKEIFHDHEISVLPNGFDPAVIMESLKLSQNKSELRISFVGTIYEWHPLDLFLKTFSAFISESSKPVKLVFYGTNKDHYVRSIVKDQFPHLAQHIEIKPKLPNQELILELAKDNVMLLFNYYAFTGTKIYDYLGLRRKILFCFTDEPEANKLRQKHYSFEIGKDVNYFPQQEIIQKTNSGIVIEDSEHLLKVLDDLYAEFEATGTIACNPVGIEQYSRKVQVKRLAEIIQNI